MGTPPEGDHGIPRGTPVVHRTPRAPPEGGHGTPRGTPRTRERVRGRASAAGAPNKLCAASVAETRRALTIEQLRCVAAADGPSSPVQWFLCANLSRQPLQWPRALRRVSGP